MKFDWLLNNLYVSGKTGSILKIIFMNKKKGRILNFARRKTL
jgi:hypothetical protein